MGGAQRVRPPNYNAVSYNVGKNTRDLINTTRGLQGSQGDSKVTGEAPGNPRETDLVDVFIDKLCMAISIPK